MKTVRLQEWGQVLGTRLLGEEIRQEAEALLDQGEVISLDFGGVEVASPSFVDELVGKLFLQRGQTALRGRLRIMHAAPEIHALIRRMVSERLKERQAPVEPVETKAIGSAETLSPPALNPFEVLSAVQQDYLTYVRTFQRFQNPEIRDWVLERVQSGTLLWKPPFIQLSRPFAPGEPLTGLVTDGLLHSRTPAIFRHDPDDPSSPPIRPYRHQSQAIRRILGPGSPSPDVGGGGQGVRAGANVVVSTGTGSGKSFCFGIPIVSECLLLRSQGVAGIKALIVYPMNALANSQYDDFARRLHGTGLRIALYTGDTRYAPAEALEQYRRATGRNLPYDSKVLSRQEIQESPPDILMTNYVMLELLLTRFEDRRLFATPGVLRFLVLDEVHTYTGKRGADVAALIRRLKQHTGTIGQLRCIATSATVESDSPPPKAWPERSRRVGLSEAKGLGEGPGVGANGAIADFVTRLFGEPFAAEDVVSESYALLPDDLPPLTRAIAQALEAGPRTLPQLATELDVPPAEIQQALLPPSNLQSLISNLQHPVPKLHAFFSQGRAITACLDSSTAPALSACPERSRREAEGLTTGPAGPHLNDRGERICPVCAQEGRERITFPMVFCRACGQEFYSVAVDEMAENTKGRLHPAELDAVDVPGQPGYLYPGRWNPEEAPLPETWLTDKGNLRSRYRDAVPQIHRYCPDCNHILPTQPASRCTHPHAYPVTFVPAPFLLCPSCGIVHDRRPREFNKLFTFGSVGRSTATDVLINAQVQNLPAVGRKVIIFSDNRQDTALQAAHMNSLHNRFAFRRALYHTLLEGGATVGSGEYVELADVGLRLFEAMRRHDVLPQFRRDRRAYGRDRQAEGRYQRYLQFVALRELQATHRRTHQNLEDVGLLAVGYLGLDECAADETRWASVPVMADMDTDARYDLLVGFLDLMRKRLAVAHDAALRPNAFSTEVLNRLDESAFVHDQEFNRPVGYSDKAPRWPGYTVYRLTGSNTQLVVWVKRVLGACPACPERSRGELAEGIDHATAVDLVGRIVEKLGDEQAAFLVCHTVRGPRRSRHDLWMVNPDVLTLQADDAPVHRVCPKCLTVQRFRRLQVCTGSTCRTTLEERNLEGNYFRQVYALSLGEATQVQSEEHSGQVSGQERRQIELCFRDPEDPLNVLVCTPTMELGIDIGHLNAVTLRNVPPSPSNYAQRAGRAGRSGQPSLITVFAGVGFARGPHDQYFYRFPEKMIAGVIVAPRFRLDNRVLIRAHIHSLVLETMGLKGVERLPGKPRDLVNLEMNPDVTGFPFYADWETTYRAGIEHHFTDILTAVEEAFVGETGRFDWFDRDFIEETVQRFVDDLDQAMERWRLEYQRLDEEREELNRLLGREGVDPALNRRRVVVEGKLQAMREGEGSWYLYRYLGGEGFLPGYAFPPEATVLSFDDQESELARNPAIALTEYAPGNFVYYRGQRYEVTHARPRTRQMQPDVEPVLACPACGRAYVGSDQTKRTACLCGQNLSGVHPRKGLALSDMYARRRARITADEEERLRLGYELTKHYMAGGRRTAYRVSAEGGPAFQLTVEHGGQVLLLNRGVREREGEPRGFTLCAKCHRWLMGENAEQKHVGTPMKRGECPRGARGEDLLQRLWLTQTVQSDLVLLDVPLPSYLAPALQAGAPAEPFYTTLLHTWLRALMVAFNLDASELDGFLVPAPEDDQPCRVVLYETAVGGSGVLASLAEQGRLRMVMARAQELLHEGDPGGGCERACYDCLLSFYNQRDHELLDRRMVLPWLQALEGLTVEAEVAEDGLALLEAQCQSDLERQVLQAIHDRGLPLPDAAQEMLYDRDGSPLAVADFYYQRGRVVVFVDGSPHYRDYVQTADERKRKRLKALGYRILAVVGGGLEEALTRLGEWLGLL